MKKLFTTLFTISCFLANAADLYVLPNAPSPYFPTIADAVANSSSGDRILISTGTYIGDVTLKDKTVTLAPMITGEDYGVAGNLYFDVSGSGDFTVTIIGANINGTVGLTGGTSNTNSRNRINFIDCDVLGTMYLQTHSALVNLYYSSFHSTISFYASNEIIGNTFDVGLGSHKSVSLYNLHFTDGSTENKLKIYANIFEDVTLYVKPNTSTYSWINHVHLANNYFNMTSNSNSYSCFGTTIDGSDVSYLIENNTMRRYTFNQPSSAAAFCYIPSSSHLLIRNNIFYDNGTNSSNYYRFWFSTSSILIMDYNLFNQSVFTLNTSSNLSYWFYDMPSSKVVENNYFNTDNYNSNNISSSGIMNTIEATNRGKDIIECRDIDNTRNNLGTWGGPHSWDNYHQNNTAGRGRIVDLSIPTTIYGLPGVSLDINGKAINTNK